MAGRYESPYRPPCAGDFESAGILRIGCNNSRVPDPAPDKWTNITRVEDYRDPTDPDYEADGIPPYPQPYLNEPTEGSCVDADPECYDSVGEIWEKKCADGGYQDDRIACATPDADHATVVRNCFEKTEELLSFPACNRGYFKNVQASKVWHGRFGYLSHDGFTPGTCIDTVLGLQRAADYICDGGDPPDCDTVDPESDCASNFESLQSTADDTKYLTINVVSRASFEDGGVETEYGEATRDVSVDPDSGVTTETGSEDGDADLAEVATDHIAENVGIEVGLQTSVGKFITYITDIRDHASTTPHQFDFTFAVTGSEITCTIENVYATPYTQYELSLDTATGDFHYIWYASDATVLSEETISMTDTGFTWETSDQWGVDYYQINTVTCTLSDAYTAGDLRQDGYDLADEWDLTDDARYPWRSDEYVGIAPLVTRSEWSMARSPTEIHALTVCVPLTATGCAGTEGVDFNNEPWVEEGYFDYDNPPADWELNYAGDPASIGDRRATAYTGEILGSPLPSGYEGFFDPNHRTWKVCDQDGDDFWFIKYQGAWAGGFVPSAPEGSVWPAGYGTNDPTDLVIPKSATQWTENLVGPGQCFNGGAWCDIEAASGRITVQKWAELKVRRPSHNYARPCGADRYAVDSDSLRCVVSSTGTPLVITLHADSDVTTGTACLVGDEVYTVTRNSATEFELTTLLATVPADCALAANQFCTLRMEDAWPICGRIAVNSATQNGGNVDLAIGQAKYLRTGDVVDLTGVPGLDDPDGYAVTVTDINNVSVVGTLTGSYGTGGFISSHGAPAYYWHDDQPKGDYRLLKWEHDFRDYQEADRVCADADASPDCAVDTTGLTCDEGVSDVRQNQALWGMPRSVKDFDFTGHCLDFACQMVMCISPNAEDWSGLTGVVGRTHGFPGTTDVETDGTTSAAGGAFAADDRYGARWQAVIQQHIADPFWQLPPKPCVECEETPAVRPTSCPWNEDDEECPEDDCATDCDPEADSQKLYPQRPWEEARIALPTNGGAGEDQTAPDLPDGYSIFPLSLDDLDTVSDPGGQVIPPPVDMGISQIVVQTPWGIFERQLACVCDEGRFLDEYQDNQVKC